MDPITSLGDPLPEEWAANTYLMPGVPSTVPPRNLTYLLATTLISLLCHGEANRNRFAAVLSESIERISQLYVEPVEPRALFEGGMRGMLSELDQYSGYVSLRDLDEFRADIEQEFGGIGIEVSGENNQLTVMNPIPGKPAFAAGIRAGDRIVMIDGENMEHATLENAVKRMRGQIGTEVVVEVTRGVSPARLSFRLRRERIDIESVKGDTRQPSGGWNFMLADHPRIAYVRLTSFGDHSAREVREALGMIAGRADGLIMDLRGNAGGLLDSAVEICNMFIPPGQVIVTTRGRDSRIVDEFKSEERPLVNDELPVVVLVDKFSASASEIFAACLQDHGRATIVGDRTWGKGTVQNVFEVDGGRGAIRLTTQTYWRPSGKNIHRREKDTEQDAWGVRPDPENLIAFTKEEYEATYERRRNRDLGLVAQAPGPAAAPAITTGVEANKSDATPNASALDANRDRQLERAIQILQPPPAAIESAGS